MIETERLRAGRAVRLHFHRPGAVTGEEGDKIVCRLEEIMAVAVMADAVRQFHAEKVAVEADGLLHVGGDQCEMIDFLQIHGDPPRTWSSLLIGNAFAGGIQLRVGA